MDSEKIAEFVKLFDNCLKNLKYEKDRLQWCNDRRSDISHEIELNRKLTRREKNKLYDEYEKTSLERRVHKDNIELMEPMYTFINENRKVFNKLQNVLGEVRKIEHRQKNRTYKRKTEKDLF